MIVRIAALLLLTQSALAQQEETVTSHITDVTVFLHQAQITRVAKVRLQPGKSTLRFTGLPAHLDAESIQVTGKGNFVLLGTSHRQNFLNEHAPNGQAKIWKDSIAILQRQIHLDQGSKDIALKEEQLLLANQDIGGANQNLTVAELKAMADFFRTRLAEIQAMKLRLDEKIVRSNERIARLQQQVQVAMAQLPRSTSEIGISVQSEAVGNAELNIVYVVQQAGWLPQYELRVTDTKKAMRLNYKAKVFQNSGEAWSQVKLKLSTGNPTLGALKPELTAWYLDFYQPMYLHDKAARKVAAPAAAEMASSFRSEDESTPSTIANYVATVQNAIQAEFNITLPYTVTSGGQGTVVDIKASDVKTSYTYTVVPKIEEDVFLMAYATEWNTLSLLPGEGQVFFEGTFVGKTYIDPYSTKDTLKVSLGRDKRIVVKREKLKDLTSRKVLGGTEKENYTYQITVRNTKQERIKLLVEDQIPVSQQSQIEVTLLDAKDAHRDPYSGKLEWNIELQPNESKTILFSFEVKYPKDKLVNVGV